jgi:hypothetical protein
MSLSSCQRISDVFVTFVKYESENAGFVALKSIPVAKRGPWGGTFVSEKAGEWAPM